MLLDIVHIESKLQLAVRKGMELLRSELINELKAQGHNNTGKLINNIDLFIYTKKSDIAGAIMMLDYARYMETGVSAEKIPYQRGSGKKTSKYINALIKYFRTKGLSEKESKRASFATARNHKKGGMPTRASFKHSKNGRRKGFVSFTLKANEEKVHKLITKGLYIEIDIAFTNIIKNVA